MHKQNIGTLMMQLIRSSCDRNLPVTVSIVGQTCYKSDTQQIIKSSGKHVNEINTPCIVNLVCTGE